MNSVIDCYKRLFLNSRWRVLCFKEYTHIEALPKNDETIEWWNGEAWDVCPTLILNPIEIYRTKRNISENIH
jgi:hypothetical protein